MRLLAVLVVSAAAAATTTGLVLDGFTTNNDRLVVDDAPHNPQFHGSGLLRLPRELLQTNTIVSSTSCEYNQTITKTFDLFYGRNQVKVGNTTVSLTTSNQLVVTYNLASTSGCTLDINDAIHVLLTTAGDPTKNLAPGLFPCQSKTNGGISQVLTCPLSIFTAFTKCCGPAIDVYTHAALTCGSGSRKETAYSGEPACTKLTKWCNVAKLSPSCECNCDPTANKCITCLFPNPSGKPSRQPSAKPSRDPTSMPSNTPTKDPTSPPSMSPSEMPSSKPSESPSNAPSGLPTVTPSTTPSWAPSAYPSRGPTVTPSSNPSSGPTVTPSAFPSNDPSVTPSNNPSKAPSSGPTVTPSVYPSNDPSVTPSNNPSKAPSSGPTMTPSAYPSNGPTVTPSNNPSEAPSSGPTVTLSAYPSSGPTGTPSIGPSQRPSKAPSRRPSAMPSQMPAKASIPVTCTVFADCVQVTPVGSCAIECKNGSCTFEVCNNNCCKYTIGNNSGGICANGCGDNNICIDSDSRHSNRVCPRNGPNVAICNNVGFDYCLCLVRNKCNKQGCPSGSQNCCLFKNDKCFDNDIDAGICPATPVPKVTCAPTKAPST